MIENVVPSLVMTAEAFNDATDAMLFPDEELLVAHAVEARRREFATTRACARRALAGLGSPPGPVLSGPNREPLWPNDVVGSLTHCTGYRAAAVAWRANLASIGIDAEPDAALPEGILEQIGLPAERTALARLPFGIDWDRLLFSAKESVYKAWHPLTGCWLGFEDALIDLRPDRGRDANRGSFAVKLLVPGAPLGGGRFTALAGRYSIDRGLVLTAFLVSPR